MALFKWLVDPCFAFIRRNCKEVVATADVTLPCSLMRLLSSQLDDFKLAVTTVSLHYQQQLASVSPSPTPGLAVPNIRVLGSAVVPNLR